MKFLYLLLSLLVFGLHGTAQAEEPTAQLSVSPEACRWAVAHTPSADVEYTPDVTIDGRPVVPADLDETTSPITTALTTQPIIIPITREIINKMGVSGQVFKAEAMIGQISVSPDGKLSFNGQPLAAPSQAELALLCQNAAAPQ